MSYDEHLISMAGGDGESDLLGEIEARAEAATEGPWEARSDSPSMDGGNWTFRRSGKPGIIISAHMYQHGGADAEFIAHARTDVPALLAMVREQRAVIERVEAQLDEWASFKPFPDAEDTQRWYSLGKRHAADSIRAALRKP